MVPIIRGEVAFTFPLSTFLRDIAVVATLLF